MSKLTIAASQDFSGQLLFQIDTIDFINGAGPRVVATFAGGQFGGAKISSAVTIDGSTGRNEIAVNTDFRGLDASGWHFSNWTTGDRVVINGSSASETITGSVRRDIISGGNGNDTINGLDGNDLISGGAGADHLKGGVGSDTLSYRGSIGAVHVDLAKSEAFGGDATGDDISGFEHVIGGNGNDELRGSAGNNHLSGGAGADVLVGGAGHDRFIFRDLGDSPAGAGRDRIADFSHAENDHIDLAAIDAVSDSRTFHNDAFAFIGTGAFTAAGQLRYFVIDGQTVIQADVNGDHHADLEIVLSGSHVLLASDFIL